MPWGFQDVEAPRFQDNRHMKVVWLSALGTGRLYLPGNFPGTHFCWNLSQPQGHSAAGRIMSMKNSSDTIGNRTRDTAACSAVPQPTNLSYEPEYLWSLLKTHLEINIIYLTSARTRLEAQDNLLNSCWNCAQPLLTLWEIWNSLCGLF